MACKNSAVWIPFVSMALGSACAETSGEGAVEATGQATIALTQAPSDAACLRVAVEGSKSVERSFDLSEGEDTSLTLKGLPLGLAAFTASAYGARCADLAPDADPTWISDAVEVEISPHDVAHVLLTMRRREGRSVVEVDFAEHGSATFSHRLDVFLFEEVHGPGLPWLKAWLRRWHDARRNLSGVCRSWETRRRRERVTWPATGAVAIRMRAMASSASLRGSSRKAAFGFRWP